MENIIFYIISAVSGFILGIGIILIPSNSRAEVMQITLDEQNKLIAELQEELKRRKNKKNYKKYVKHRG